MAARTYSTNTAQARCTSNSSGTNSSGTNSGTELATRSTPQPASRCAYSAGAAGAADAADAAGASDASFSLPHIDSFLAIRVPVGETKR